MDSRLIILAVSFSLLVVSLLSLVVQIIGARRRRPLPNFEPLPAWPMLASAPPEVAAASTTDLFAESKDGVRAALNEPLRAGEWKPSQSQPTDLPRTSGVDDYWDSLISEDSPLVHPVAGVPREPTVVDLWPDAVRQEQPMAAVPIVESEPQAAAPEPVLPTLAESERIAEIVAELEEDAHTPTEELLSPVLVELHPTAAEPRPTEVEVVPSTTTVAQPTATHVPEHELVAPVEMWFGEYRIGVRAGTRTYDRFQKIANTLFEDFKQATSSR